MQVEQVEKRAPLIASRVLHLFSDDFYANMAN
jgi:hypothetical protein